MAMDHVHPKMIFEIISFLTRKGSISIADVIKMAEPREMIDLNRKDIIKSFKPADRLALERDNLDMLQEALRKELESQGRLKDTSEMQLGPGGIMVDVKALRRKIID